MIENLLFVALFGLLMILFRRFRDLEERVWLAEEDVRGLARHVGSHSHVDTDLPIFFGTRPPATSAMGTFSISPQYGED